MDQGGSCLSDSQALRFIVGEVGEGSRLRVERHVDECDACLKLVAGAAGDSVSALGPPEDRFRPSVLVPGVTIAGRYHVRRLLGVGGMGEVHEVDDRTLGKTIAIKTLNAKLTNDRQALELLKAEVAMAHRVTHQNVCRIFDLGVDNGADPGSPLIFLTMEHLRGQTLSTLLKEGPLPPPAAFSIARQIAEGLAAAHAVGVIHRDLKPDNIMLVDQSGERRAVIMDFGLARLTELDKDEPADGSFAGTVNYAAPEQLGGQSATPASDVYAAGLVSYEMLFGRLAPGTAADRLKTIARGLSRAVGEGLSAEWASIIARAVEPSPGRRFTVTVPA